jgi:hypothetical protein
MRSISRTNSQSIARSQEYDGAPNTHAALLLAQRSPLAPLELFGLKSNSERASASRQSSDGR